MLYNPSSMEADDVCPIDVVNHDGSITDLGVIDSYTRVQKEEPRIENCMCKRHKIDCRFVRADAFCRLQKSH